MLSNFTESESIVEFSNYHIETEMLKKNKCNKYILYIYLFDYVCVVFITFIILLLKK